MCRWDPVAHTPLPEHLLTPPPPPPRLEAAAAREVGAGFGSGSGPGSGSGSGGEWRLDLDLRASPEPDLRTRQVLSWTMQALRDGASARAVAFRCARGERGGRGVDDWVGRPCRR